MRDQAASSSSNHHHHKSKHFMNMNGGTSSVVNGVSAKREHSSGRSTKRRSRSISRLSNKENGSKTLQSSYSIPVNYHQRHSKSKSRRRHGSDSGSDSSSSSNYSESDSSDSDCMEPVVAVVRRNKKLKRDDDSIAHSINGKDKDSASLAGSSDSNGGKETAPVSPVSRNSTESDQTRMSTSRDGSESPVPEDEWEIEEIRDYVREDFRELYYVKWKDWADEFNTWEPPHNLLNCTNEMLRFYFKRRKQYQKVKNESEYVVLPNGKQRRKGPPLPAVPPDPRSLEERRQEFLDKTGCQLSEKDILNVFQEWKSTKNSSLNLKPRWPRSKVDSFLEDGIDGKLTRRAQQDLLNELILIEVERKDAELRKDLKDWERRINITTGSKPFITVENNVDMCGPKTNFQFVNDYVPGMGVIIPTDPPVGCECDHTNGSCYDQKSICCAFSMGYKFAYTKYRKINLEMGSPIYECNKKCTCGPDCPNRVVQDGKTDHKLCIFRTDNGRGWGVKTLKGIKKGTFVSLYVGEVIKSAEADKRGKIYDETGTTYLFDLDYNDPEDVMYSVDASQMGNVAHFFNHSCDPNIGVYNVWTDCLDPNLPKLAMFALRDIPRNEELAFDYNRKLNSEFLSTKREDHDPTDSDSTESVSSNKGKHTLCLCGSKKCRKYIYIF